MTYRAVFLDLDDTLYPYPPCNAAGKEAAWRQARDLGYDLDRERFEELYQEARREVKRELAGTASAHERYLYFKRAVEIHTGSHRSADALELGETYWDAYIEEMTLFDGVESTLERLRVEGLAVAIVSNLTTRIQMKKLDHLGLSQYADLVVTSEETGREKPSAIMFTLPMAQLDLRPSEVLMVGDSIESDVEGGNAAGLTTALFNADADGRTGMERPDHELDAFDEIAEVAL
jgi:putative hydrolase of the HAD superfamily